MVRVLVVSREQIGVVNCQSRASGFNTCSFIYLISSEQDNDSFICILVTRFVLWGS